MLYWGSNSCGASRELPAQTNQILWSLQTNHIVGVRQRERGEVCCKTPSISIMQWRKRVVDPNSQTRHVVVVMGWGSPFVVACNLVQTCSMSSIRWIKREYCYLPEDVTMFVSLNKKFTSVFWNKTSELLSCFLKWEEEQEERLIGSVFLMWLETSKSEGHFLESEGCLMLLDT